MKKVSLIFLFAFLAILAVPPTSAQVVVGIGVSPLAPVCEYGYYDYAPYACAPVGYYGADWFSGGLFIGTGPWFGGRYNPYFRGGNGYHGPHGNFVANNRAIVRSGGRSHGFSGGAGHMGGGHR
jgi:hypothetical protein